MLYEVIVNTKYTPQYLRMSDQIWLSFWLWPSSWGHQMSPQVLLNPDKIEIEMFSRPSICFEEKS